MIERATDDEHPFDAIVVHSYSRFFRDSFVMEMYQRRLRKVGVRLLSITQEFGDEPCQVMTQRLYGLFDEYPSHENAKHVLRAMKENARPGFYNGAPVPLGYMLVEVEKRGTKIKKRLAVDTVEAETIKQIFRLYRDGDGTSRALGVKAITCWLNERGYRTRKDAGFGVATTHGILTNRVYVGEWVFNRRCSKTLAKKPKAEPISISVPAIIELAEFEAVQTTLKAHNPRVTPARVVTGPILLTGLATCATCNGPMTLRTGTSKSGRVHKYYSCSTHGRMGKTGCTGRSIRMDTLDTQVTDCLVAKLLQPDRLRSTLASLWPQRAEKSAQVDGRVSALRGEVAGAEDKLKRLYRMVEEEMTDLDEILKDRLKTLKEERDRAAAAFDRIRVAERAPIEIAPELVERFGRLMRDGFTTGNIPFRQAWLQGIIGRVEVGEDVIRIIGDKASLEAAITGTASSPTSGVRSSVSKWRARKDSNL